MFYPESVKQEILPPATLGIYVPHTVPFRELFVGEPRDPFLSLTLYFCLFKVESTTHKLSLRRLHKDRNICFVFLCNIPSSNSMQFYFW